MTSMMRPAAARAYRPPVRNLRRSFLPPVQVAQRPHGAVVAPDASALRAAAGRAAGATGEGAVGDGRERRSSARSAEPQVCGPVRARHRASGRARRTDDGAAAGAYEQRPGVAEQPDAELAALDPSPSRRGAHVLVAEEVTEHPGGEPFGVRAGRVGRAHDLGAAVADRSMTTRAQART